MIVIRSKKEQGEPKKNKHGPNALPSGLADGKCKYFRPYSFIYFFARGDDRNRMTRLDPISYNFPATLNSRFLG